MKKECFLKVLLIRPRQILVLDRIPQSINDALLAYCEQEQITFTRGRPALKNDQWLRGAEKWACCASGGGYSRSVGEPTFAYLGDLSRVLSQYVNFFQL